MSDLKQEQRPWLKRVWPPAVLITAGALNVVWVMFLVYVVAHLMHVL